eukprot:scaffold2870_cov267-Pinguiococcus_pyrenoidosus.AAC.3
MKSSGAVLLGGFDVSSLREEQGHDVLAIPGSRYDERRCTCLVGGVRVSASTQEHSNRLSVAFLRRDEQRRGAALRCSFEIRASFQQQMERLFVTPFRCHVQSGLSVARRFDVCAAVKEQGHHLLVMVVGGNEKRRVSVKANCLHACAMLQQERHHPPPTLLRGKQHRRQSILLPRINHGSVAEQQPHHRRMALLRGDAQRRGAIPVRPFDVGARTQQLFHHVLVVVACRHVQRRSTLLRRHADVSCPPEQQLHDVHVTLLRRDEGHQLPLPRKGREKQESPAILVIVVDVNVVVQQLPSLREVSLGHRGPKRCIKAVHDARGPTPRRPRRRKERCSALRSLAKRLQSNGGTRRRSSGSALALQQEALPSPTPLCASDWLRQSSKRKRAGEWRRCMALLAIWAFALYSVGRCEEGDRGESRSSPRSNARRVSRTCSWGDGCAGELGLSVFATAVCGNGRIPRELRRSCFWARSCFCGKSRLVSSHGLKVARGGEHFHRLGISNQSCTCSARAAYAAYAAYAARSYPDAASQRCIPRQGSSLATDRLDRPLLPAT